MRRRAAVSILALCLAGWMAHGCSGTSEGPNRDAGSGPSGDAGAGGASDGAWREGSAGLCRFSPPSAVPSGWVQWTGYDPCCAFYVPATAAALPPPIAWMDCDASSQPSGARCRQMVANLSYPAADPQPFGVGNAACVAADGTVMLAAERHIDVGGQTGSYQLVAEADGPVHQALIWTLPTKCTALVQSIQDGKVVYGVYENGG